MPVRIFDEREIELLSRMSHPNIVSLAGVSLSPTERFYVMPLYERSLRDWIGRASGAASPVQVARFGERLSEALRYAHGGVSLHATCMETPSITVCTPATAGPRRGKILSSRGLTQLI